MMRQTAKYTAGIALARRLGAKMTAGVTTHAALYDSLEGHGYWWNADNQQWTNAAKPSTSVFSDDAAGSVPSGVVKLRVMTHPDESDAATKELRDLVAGEGWETIEQSAPYPNRRGVGVRVYLTFKRR